MSIALANKSTKPLMVAVVSFLQAECLAWQSTKSTYDMLLEKKKQ